MPNGLSLLIDNQYAHCICVERIPKILLFFLESNRLDLTALPAWLGSTLPLLQITLNLTYQIHLSIKVNNLSAFVIYILHSM